MSFARPSARAVHVPMRTCVGCRRRAPAAELLRVHRAGDGVLALGAGPGRGAWLCGEPSTLTCFDQAVRRRALSRTLRAALSATELAELRATLEGRRLGGPTPEETKA